MIGAGGILAGSNPAYTSNELVHHFKTTNAKYVIAQVDCLQAVEAAATECQIPAAYIFVLEKPDLSVPAGKQSWRSLLDHGECDWNTSPDNHKSFQQNIAVYGTTSGTTGLPKACMIPHCYYVAQAAMIEERLKDRPYQVPSPPPSCLCP